MCMYMCIYVHVYVYMCMYMCVYVYMYMCVYVYMCMCMFIYVYVYVCMYMYTYPWVLPFSFLLIPPSLCLGLLFLLAELHPRVALSLEVDGWQIIQHSLYLKLFLLHLQYLKIM